MKIIPVGQLLPGMFVQSVTRQTGSIKIKNQGWVKTQAGINNLIKAGILEVEIDPDKTLIDSVPEKAPITVPATKIKRYRYCTVQRAGKWLYGLCF